MECIQLMCNRRPLIMLEDDHHSVLGEHGMKLLILILLKPAVMCLSAQMSRNLFMFYNSRVVISCRKVKNNSLSEATKACVPDLYYSLNYHSSNFWRGFYLRKPVSMIRKDCRQWKLYHHSLFSLKSLFPCFSIQASHSFFSV